MALRRSLNGATPGRWTPTLSTVAALATVSVMFGVLVWVAAAFRQQQQQIGRLERQVACLRDPYRYGVVYTKTYCGPKWWR